MYDWRKMSDEERNETLKKRMSKRRPWHHPPKFEEEKWFHLTAACYEHRPYIGQSVERMAAFSDALCVLCSKPLADLQAWVVLPNHYHILVRVYAMDQLRKRLGQHHGRCSHTWNVEEGCRGRTCFHGSLFKEIKSEAHRNSTLNYIHHNPVKHGYVDKWADWPFGSALTYLSATPVEIVKRQWDSFPIHGMGKGWDEK